MVVVTIPEGGVRERVGDMPRFRFTALAGEVTCRIQLFAGADQQVVVVATQHLEGEGPSLVNAQSQVVAAVQERLLGGRPPLHWYQVLLPSAQAESVVCQRVEGPGGTAGDASEFAWTSVSIDDLKAAVGADVDLGRGPGFHPVPTEAAQPDRFCVIPLLVMPMPSPFRDGGCMPATSRARLVQAALRRRGPGCSQPGCSYHGGDWRRASAAAIAGLRHARSAGATDQRAAARDHLAANLTGWELVAADSLFHDPIGLPSSWWRRPPGYSNGQHRTRAMLDQGVLATVILAQP